MKKININLQNFILSLADKKYKAFTLAEILLSLTVIGIVAAIALPSLLGNAQERAWETQKKALYTRFSQSLALLPSLNGYGELVGNLPSATGNDLIPENQLKDTAAESFIRDGLSKVMKITNICDNDHLTDCGLPDKIVSIDGTTTLKLSSIKTVYGFNVLLKSISNANFNGTLYNYEQLNAKAAAFETVNGESVLIYYNPNCEPDLHERGFTFSQAKVCANFVYDLNGKKGPNTAGKDIGFITALYATDPIVVAPNTSYKIIEESLSISDAIHKCKEYDAKLPTLQEGISMFYNRNLVNLSGSWFLSSTSYSGDSNWLFSGWTGAFFSARIDSGNSQYLKILCLKR